MREVFDGETGIDQFLLHWLEVPGDDNHVGIDCINRLDVVVHGQAADQTPWGVLIENRHSFSERAGAPVGNRLIDLLRSHSAGK